LRQEEIANRIVLGFGQTERAGGLQQFMGNAACQSGAVAKQRIGADRTAVGQILENLQSVTDGAVRGLAFHVGDETDAAGIMFVRRIIKSLALRQARNKHVSPGAAGISLTTSRTACLACRHFCASLA